jgi:hypothetical protein
MDGGMNSSQIAREQEHINRTEIFNYGSGWLGLGQEEKWIYSVDI